VVVLKNDGSLGCVLVVAGRFELSLNQTISTVVKRSDRLDNHLVCRVHWESFTIIYLTSRLLDNFIIVVLGLALLRGKDVEVHVVVVQIELPVNLNLGLGSIRVSLLLFKLGFGVCLLSVLDLLGSFSNLVEADCQGTAAEAAAHDQHKNHKDTDKAVPCGSIEVECNVSWGHCRLLLNFRDWRSCSSRSGSGIVSWVLDDSRSTWRCTQDWCAESGNTFIGLNKSSQWGLESSQLRSWVVSILRFNFVFNDDGASVNSDNLHLRSVDS